MSKPTFTYDIVFVQRKGPRRKMYCGSFSDWRRARRVRDDLNWLRTSRRGYFACERSDGGDRASTVPPPAQCDM